MEETEREFLGKYETDMGGLGGERLGVSGGSITKGTSEWEGWGTALKPAHEPICMARKPLDKGCNIAENCLKWGTGGINIDISKIKDGGHYLENQDLGLHNSAGRFPANLIHDGSEEVKACFPDSVSKQAPRGGQGFHNAFGRPDRERLDGEIAKGHNDSGNASRFFKSIIYQAKASKSDRNEGCENLYILKDGTPEDIKREIKNLLDIS